MWYDSYRWGSTGVDVISGFMVRAICVFWFQGTQGDSGPKGDPGSYGAKGGKVRLDLTYSFSLILFCGHITVNTNK